MDVPRYFNPWPCHRLLSVEEFEDVGSSCERFVIRADRSDDRQSTLYSCFVLNKKKCSFGASCLINATLRALTRSVYQRSTHDHRLSFSLSLSLFFFLFLSSCLLKVAWLSKQIVIRPVACMNLYLLKLRILSGNGSSFEKVNERSKGTFSTSQGNFRPGRRTKVLSHCSMIYVSIGLSSGILNRVLVNFVRTTGTDTCHL